MPPRSRNLTFAKRSSTREAPSTQVCEDRGSVADLAELKATIEAVERELAEAREQLRESESTVERIDEARVQAEGRLAIARRAVSSFEERLGEQRQALLAATREAAVEAYQRAVRERDAAVERAAIAVRAVISAYEAIEAARATVADAAEEARRLGATVPRMPPPEPRLPEEDWTRVHQVLGAASQARLDEELVAAAAASNRMSALENLPPHLREAARARRARRGSHA